VSAVFTIAAAVRELSGGRCSRSSAPTAFLALLAREPFRHATVDVRAGGVNVDTRTFAGPSLGLVMFATLFGLCWLSGSRSLLEPERDCSCSSCARPTDDASPRGLAAAGVCIVYVLAVYGSAWIIDLTGLTPPSKVAAQSAES
jgi:hypothetical protein